MTENPNAAQSFYLKKVPQSEYRRTEDREGGEKQYLDLSLPELDIDNNSVRQALKDKIKEESKRVGMMLLPEKIWNAVDHEEYLKEIYYRLGLL